MEHISAKSRSDLETCPYIFNYCISKKYVIYILYYMIFMYSMQYVNICICCPYIFYICIQYLVCMLYIYIFIYLYHKCKTHRPTPPTLRRNASYFAASVVLLQVPPRAAVCACWNPTAVTVGIFFKPGDGIREDWEFAVINVVYLEKQRFQSWFLRRKWYSWWIRARRNQLSLVVFPSWSLSPYNYTP